MLEHGDNNGDRQPQSNTQKDEKQHAANHSQATNSNTNAAVTNS